MRSLGVPISDFLASITNPEERTVRVGFDEKVPHSAIDFARIWQGSPETTKLLEEIKDYEERPDVQPGVLPRQLLSPQRGKRFAPLPYMIGLHKQTCICLKRGFQRLAADPAPALSSIGGNAIVSIILGSMFYSMPNDTSSFSGRSVLLFFVVLTNTFLGAFEGVQLWDHRPIVEKHFHYAFYRPAAEAIASMLCDLPKRLLLTTLINITFHFLANMRRTPRAFFTFYVFAFLSLLTGSMLFRAIGALSKTVDSSIAPGADFILMLIVYMGFVLPIQECILGFDGSHTSIQ